MRSAAWAKHSRAARVRHRSILRPRPKHGSALRRYAGAMSPSRPAPRLPVELALLVLLATLWGASYTFMKVAIATIPPATLIAARTLIAGVLLTLVLRLRGVAWPRDPRTWASFLVQAVLNSVVPFTLIAWAVRTI